MELKFRAWNFMVHRYQYFNLIDIENQNSRIQWHILDINQFTGLQDKNGNEIYANDILSDGKHKFRVYAIPGGFGIKALAWAYDMKDIIPSDVLIMKPLADTQTQSYIRESIEVVGNIHEK